MKERNKGRRNKRMKDETKHSRRQEKKRKDENEERESSKVQKQDRKGGKAGRRASRRACERVAAAKADVGVSPARGRRVSLVRSWVFPLLLFGVFVRWSTGGVTSGQRYACRYGTRCPFFHLVENKRVAPGNSAL